MSINNRTFRVFVSSTFSDLKAERNALQEMVFPKLQKLCKEHGCTFQAIDLRWGVNNEATLDHKTMDICLKEIARCQETRIKPNFIVLLGNRYGWRPLPARINNSEFSELSKFVSADDMALLEDWYLLDSNALYDLEGRKEVGVWTLKTRAGKFEDWDVWEAEEKKLHSILLEAVNQASLSPEQSLKFTASATEQEIVNGALNVENAGEHVFCYFRDIENLPVDEASKDFVDLQNENGNWQVDQEAQSLLENLKESLCHSLGDNVRDQYSANWAGDRSTTDHIQQLCDDVYEDLQTVIKAEINQMEEVDPLEREVAVHQEFGQDRAKFFTGRAIELDEIQAYLDNNEKNPLLVYGESGTGKSALLGKAVENCEENNPDSVLIQRFVGASAGSSSPATLLQDLCREICREYGVDDSDVATDYWDLTKEFHRRLTRASEEKPLIIFIDALDQLSQINDQADLSWLTPGLPDHVKIVVSVIPGEWFDSARDRLSFGRIFELKGMNPHEADQLLHYWLRNANRTLTSGQRAEVLDKFAQNGLPLYLKLAFEESRLWHSFTPDGETELDPTIEGTIRGLFNRLSQNSNHGGLMVSRSLGYLAASRYGLSEEEILEILTRDQELFDDFCQGIHHELPEQRLPIVVWSRLFHDLDEYLTIREMDGIPLINFYHRQLRNVVEAEYLADLNKEHHHLHLADYFDSLNLCDRKVVELPWQYKEVEAWEWLYDLLMDYSFFFKAWESIRFEMMRYWGALEKTGIYDRGIVAKEFVKYVDSFKTQDIWNFHDILSAFGKFEEAFVIGNILVDKYDSKNEREQLCSFIGNQGVLAANLNDKSAAMMFFKKHEHLCRELGNNKELASCLGNQGVLFLIRGDLEKAMTLFEEQERLSRKCGDNSGLCRSLANQGVIHFKRNELNSALDVMQKEIEIIRSLGDVEGYQLSIGNLGVVLMHHGDFSNAERLFREQENICIEIGNYRKLISSLENQLILANKIKNYQLGLRVCEKLESVCRKFDKKEKLIECLEDKIMLLSKMFRFRDMVEICRIQEEIARELGKFDVIVSSYENQVYGFTNIGDYENAYLILKKLEHLFRQLGKEERLWPCLSDQGVCLKNLGDLEGAKRLYSMVEATFRNQGDKAGLSKVLGNLAGVYFAQGDLEGALKLHGEEEIICKELGDDSGLSSCYGNQGIVLKEQGLLENAMGLFVKQENIAREIGDYGGISTSLTNQAILLFNNGKISKALKLKKEAISYAVSSGLSGLAEQIEHICASIQ